MTSLYVGIVFIVVGSIALVVWLARRAEQRDREME